MLGFDILKGFAVGVCASVPIGPVAILTIQKTFSKGRKSGFVTGLGATLTDTTYSTIAVFALALAERFMTEYERYIFLVGGVVVMVVGWFMMQSNPFKNFRRRAEASYSVKDFAQAAVMGLSNPGAIFIIFGLFAFFGLGSRVASAGWMIVPIIAAVCLGSVTYWYSITRLLGRFRDRISLRTILRINRVAGALVMALGLILMVRGMLAFLHVGAGV